MDIAKLYDLQKIDANMEKIRRRVAHIRKGMGESDELRQARTAVTETRAELERLRTRQLDAELNGRQLAERIGESERRLMSGEVRNAKELEALQASIESMKRQRAQIDDLALESFQRGDETERQLKEKETAQGAVEAAWRSAQEGLQQEELKYRRAYAQLKQQRQTLSERIGAETMAVYTRLSERKAGVAVAAVQNGMCSACNVTLPTGVVSNAHIQEGDPVYCPSCGRILFAG